MLKWIHTWNKSYKYNSTHFLTTAILTCSHLKFSGMSLFTIRVVLCIQTSNLDVFDPKNQAPLACIEVSWVDGCWCLWISASTHHVAWLVSSWRTKNKRHLVTILSQAKEADTWRSGYSERGYKEVRRKGQSRTSGRGWSVRLWSRFSVQALRKTLGAGTCVPLLIANRLFNGWNAPQYCHYWVN